MNSSAHPELEDRFLMPDGWSTERFVNEDTGRNLHYGFVFPGGDVRAAVVCLEGLREFTEKYYEIAHDMLERGYAFFVMDWFYQGRSGRFEKNSHKRHSDGFGADLSDLHCFIEGQVRGRSGEIPLVMIAHSMGGNLGIRYLLDHPGVFRAAAFSSPMFGIRVFRYLPYSFMEKFLKMLLSLGKCYVPGGTNWHGQGRGNPLTDMYSSDPVRNKVNNKWCEFDPELKVGSVTIKWLYEAVKSCRKLYKSGVIEKIEIPVVVGIAGRDLLVDSKKEVSVSERIPEVDILDLDNSLHEVMMEKDGIRGAFLKAFDDMIENKGICQGRP
jgi:lysophospholipase